MNNKTEFYKNRNAWVRGLYMLLFIFLMGVAKFVMFVVVIMQFVVVLFTAQTNDNLARFGKSLSGYQYQIMLFLTYNSEIKPFPIGDWPE